MRALWSEKLIENNKGFRVLKSANLLYKSTSIPATSHYAKIARGLPIAFSCSLVRPRAGSGKQASRSSAQTGHDSAELGAEQKICRRPDIRK
jgi:hypothetical protein